MATIADLSKALNRPAVYLAGLQSRFELPPLQTIPNSKALVHFLQAVIVLRSLNISEDSLRELWRLEKKLLQLVHADATGSATWYLDACGQRTNRHRRLLLSNYDVRMDLSAGALQLGLDFTKRPTELFAGKEMGEDAIRVLTHCVKINRAISRQIKDELPHLRAAINWTAPLANLAT